MPPFERSSKMNRTKRNILAVILVVILLLLPTAVLAKELGLLTISGPGIKGEASLNNHDDMMSLEQSGFFDQAKFVKSPPANLGQGYTITAHLNLDGKLTPFVEMVYYPAAEGEPGYVHYIGRLNGESLQSVDEWGQMLPQAESVLRDLMTANKITIQPAIIAAPQVAKPAIEPAKIDKQSAAQSEKQPAIQPASAPAVASTSNQQVYFVGAALIASILLLLGAGVALRRRAVSQSRV
jgi:hypothetical protein